MILRKSSQKRCTVPKNSKNPNLRYSCDCAGPPLVRVRGIWVFGVFWDSTTFLATLSQKCGTAWTKPLILLKLSHIFVKSSQKRCTVPKNPKNPNPTYSHEGRSSTISRVPEIWVFWVFWDSTTFLATFSQHHKFYQRNVGQYNVFTSLENVWLTKNTILPWSLPGFSWTQLWFSWKQLFYSIKRIEFPIANPSS